MKKILIIEDEQPIRTNIEEVLQLCSYEAITACDGNVGLKIAKEELPDLILCDISMPNLDGYGVLASLRQETATASIPFVFLTANSSRSDIRRGMELGADDYLTKPFTQEELLGTVMAQLGKHGLQEQQFQGKLESLRNGITHTLPQEISSSLNTILDLSQLLIEDHGLIGEAEGFEIAESLQHSAIQLHRLIQNYLLYAELELLAMNPERVKQMQRHPEISLVKDTVLPIAYQYAHQYNRERDLALELEDSLVQLSELKLKKVVQEVLDNAFKFSQPGSPIRLVGQSQGSNYILYIIDNGQGMSPSQVESVTNQVMFDRKIREEERSGLGLAIAKRITELYGGEFRVESIVGKQTIVRLAFRRGRLTAKS